MCFGNYIIHTSRRKFRVHPSRTFPTRVFSIVNLPINNIYIYVYILLIIERILGWPFFLRSSLLSNCVRCPQALVLVQSKWTYRECNHLL